MSLLLSRLELGVLSIILIIGVLALTAELTEYEEIAKLVVIPSLVLLIAITCYAMWKSYVKHWVILAKGISFTWIQQMAVRRDAYCYQCGSNFNIDQIRKLSSLKRALLHINILYADIIILILFFGAEKFSKANKLSFHSVCLFGSWIN